MDFCKACSGSAYLFTLIKQSINKKAVMLAAVFIFALSISSAWAVELIPLPSKVQWGSEKVCLSGSAQVAGTKENPRAFNALKNVFTDSKISISSKSDIQIALGKKETARIFPEESAALNKLSREGYLLKIASHGKKTYIALAGGEEAGTFYAVQTLRQILSDGKTIHSVRIWDTPAFKERGYGEVFYGKPWTHEERIAAFRFMGETKMNIYMYSPKDDAYNREKWREDYPAQEVQRMKELLQASNDNFVEFSFAISPGLSMVYSSDEDFKILCHKFDQMYDIGIRNLSLQLDDIPLQLQHDEDKARFKNLGQAHAYITTKLFNYFKVKDPTIKFSVGPSMYYIAKPDEYTLEMGAGTDPSIPFYWSGNDICDPQLKLSDVDLYASGIRRKPYIWDNYPVNDYATDRLFMGPLKNRHRDLIDHAYPGLLENPMNQEEASKVALATIADYTWNPKVYDPMRSWKSAIELVAGKKGYAPLRLFCEQSQSCFLNPTESPELRERIESFLGNPTPENRKALKNLFYRFATIREELGSTISNKKLLNEIDPFTAKLAAYGKTGLECLEIDQPSDSKHFTANWKRRLALTQRIDELNKIPQKICGNMMDRFILRTAMGGIGLGIPCVYASSSIDPWDTRIPEYMLDGDLKTIFWGGRALKQGDWITLNLGSVRAVTKVNVLMGVPERPDDRVHEGILEYSQDLKNWNTLVPIREQEVTWKGSARNMRAIRIRVTKDQLNWPNIREIIILSVGQPTAQTNMALAEGSHASAVCDGSVLSTLRTSGLIKAGQEIRLDLGKIKTIKGVTLLMDPNAYIHATRIEISTDGSRWMPVSECHECALKTQFAPVLARYVQVVSEKDQSTPAAIHEIAVQ